MVRKWVQLKRCRVCKCYREGIVVISICCVGFASLDVVCDELNDCAWNVGL